MAQAGEPSGEIFQLALHAAPSGILVVGERGEIQFANQTLAEMFGYRMDELVGQPVEILLPEAHVAAHRRHVESYARRPDLRPMGAGRDLEAVTRDGRRFPVEIGLRPAPRGSGSVAVATVVDITKRKAIEERLRRHEEELEQLVAERTHALRQAQQEKERMLEHLIQAEKMTVVGTLVSGIGHEINNPLYILQAAAEALADEQDVAQCRAYGREILKRARNIAETVRNLSSYARPATRHDLTRMDINVPVAGAVQLARRSLRDDRIEITTALGPALYVLARPEEIQQALFNLLRNAIQAIAGRGRIAIETAREGDWITVRVQDTGKGIAANDLKRIFDPFFTTKGPDEGEGLGLYIVRQVVTRYAGTIEAANADGGGARFVIRFPSADQNTSEGKLP